MHHDPYAPINLKNLTPDQQVTYWRGLGIRRSERLTKLFILNAPTELIEAELKLVINAVEQVVKARNRHN